jgi:hypothetical protein
MYEPDCSRLIRCLWLVGALGLVAACAEPSSSGGPDADKTVQGIKEKSDEVAGLFTLLRNRDDGALHMVVRPDQLDQRIIYHMHVADGVAELGLFRGNYGRGKVFMLRRHYDRIEFVEQNTAYYFDPASPLARASEANRPAAIVAAEEIVAEDDEALVIRLDSVLLKEQLAQIKPTPAPDAKPGDRFVLGKLSESRSKVISAKSYPENTEVVVEYVYENQAPAVTAGADVTNSRSVSVQVQHSFLAMPDSDYAPRFDDYRVGYFTSRVTNLTSDSHTPYRDLIKRWHLEKKNPDAFLSDPVEPITFWIENTTPIEFRDTIREAALSWNSAFEKAGFSNALEVRVQPDDADWDAGDIRYNVLRWTSSPRPPFGGMGPSFANPLTGQILGADIMLEYSFVTNYMRTQELLQPRADVFDPARHCILGSAMQQNYAFARMALDVQGVGDELKERLFRDALSMLILHEIGHTLGLNHNMKASQLNEDPFDAGVVGANGLSGSVMDYEAVNIAPAGREQTMFFQSRPGPYDDWAIEFGYSPAVPDPDEERERLEVLLQRSSEPELAFGNDADDMRRPGNGIDPRVNIFDMGRDALGYATMRIEHLKQLHGRLLENYQHYDSWQPLANGHRSLVGQWGQNARVIAGYVGGVYVQRLPPGERDSVPFTPVSLDEQKRAMRALRDHVFADGVFSDAEILRRAQPQRRGFDFLSAPEDPPWHQMVLDSQRQALVFLLNANVLQRMTNARHYGNEYDVASMLGDLSDAVFSDDLKGNVSTQRQNLQIEYVNQLAGLMTGAGVDHVARSGVHYQLDRIRDWMRKKRGGNAETKAHTGHVLFLTDKALSVQG